MSKSKSNTAENLDQTTDAVEQPTAEVVQLTPSPEEQIKAALSDLNRSITKRANYRTRAAEAKEKVDLLRTELLNMNTGDIEETEERDLADVASELRRQRQAFEKAQQQHIELAKNMIDASSVIRVYLDELDKDLANA